jgi:pimeloyl-ACP methyl ester carboxylesterase
MLHRTAILLASSLSLTASMSNAQDTTGRPSTTMATSFVSGYAAVNGLNLYYERHGKGEPLILLHGGISASESFGANLSTLAASREVIAVHLQGHGHTKDIDRPFRFELMADDVAAFVEYLHLGRVDILGYSQGGGVALQVAIRHPAIVNRLIVVSEPMKHAGWYPEVAASFSQMSANAPMIGANVARSPMAKLYPDKDWVALFRKTGELNSRDYDWTEGVAAVKSPTMLIFADADAVRLDHIMEFYKALGGGQRDAGLDGTLRPRARLAIVPGATHYDILATTAVADLAGRFLAFNR